MKNKSNLLFAFLYFGCILAGYFANFFDPLFKNIYYGHLVYVFNCIMRVAIYIIGALILSLIYMKINNETSTKGKTKLPLKRKIILYCITLFFITIISIMANWQLKPLSDLGDKYNSIKIYGKLSDIAVNAVEIYLMMKIFVHFDKFYISNFKNNDKFSFSIIFVLLTFGIYRLIVDFTIFQFIFIPFTILLGFIYPFTNKSFFKTYLIALLVFLF